MTGSEPPGGESLSAALAGELAAAVGSGRVQDVKGIIQSNGLEMEDLKGNGFHGQSDFLGESLLHIAAWNGNMEMAKYLIDTANADVNLPSCMEKATPLHLASSRGHFPLVKMLVGFNADLNALKNNNYTPLHLAATLGNVDLVTYFLELGAKPDLAGNDGMTPLDLAESKDHLQVIAAFRRAGVAPPVSTSLATASLGQQQQQQQQADTNLGELMEGHSPSYRKGSNPLKNARIKAQIAEYKAARPPSKPIYVPFDVTNTVIEEEDLREEFGKLDTLGRGWVPKSDFKKYYMSLEDFGAGEHERSLDELLSQCNLAGDERIDFQEFSLFMLRRARR